MKQRFTKTMSLLFALVLAFGAFACAEEGGNHSRDENSEAAVDFRGINFETEGNETVMDKYETQNPVVAIYVKDYGVIVAELYPEIAPNTVNNFLSLVKAGFYDDNTIHRMQPGFVIQGGDPLGTGVGNPGYSIKGEFTENGFENNLKHEKGVLSMARSQPNDSAGCQFFIMLDASPGLDGKYASFGKVIDGFDVCEEIEKIRYYHLTTGKLNQNLTIVKMVADLKGKSYPEPETIK